MSISPTRTACGRCSTRSSAAMRRSSRCWKRPARVNPPASAPRSGREKPTLLSVLGRAGGADLLLGHPRKFLDGRFVEAFDDTHRHVDIGKAAAALQAGVEMDDAAASAVA